MHSVKPGDPITADWANALASAIDKHSTPSKTTGEQTPSTHRYTPASCPRPFSIKKITAESTDSLTAIISGGLLIYRDESNILATITIPDVTLSFTAGSKLYATIGYTPETNVPYTAFIQTSSSFPASSHTNGRAIVPLGEFTSANGNLTLTHYGIYHISWASAATSNLAINSPLFFDDQNTLNLSIDSTWIPLPNLTISSEDLTISSPPYAIRPTITPAGLSLQIGSLDLSIDSPTYTPI